MPFNGAPPGGTSRRGSRARLSLAAASCGFALLVTPLLGLSSSCAPLGSGLETVIEPARVGLEDSRLGPGVRALSAGPGDKGSPRPSPSGQRVAFVSDGLPVERPLGTAVPPEGRGAAGGTSETQDNAAVGVEWIGGDALASLSPSEEAPGSLALSVVQKGRDPVLVADGVADAAPVEGGVLAAVEVAPETSDAPSSRLVIARGAATRTRLLAGELPGRVTGLSVSPDGGEAALALRNGESAEIWTYRLSDGRLRLLARLRGGLEVLGAPQLAAGAAYFVVGEGMGRSGDTSSYALYHTPHKGPGHGSEDGGSMEPKPVEDVGEDFVAAGVRVSPEGGRLAVLGRRSASAPVEVYVLNLSSGELRSATRNEDMEIKTAPKDLAWTPDGGSVIVVARGLLSAPETYAGPASNLRTAFFNLYEVPVGPSPGGTP